MASVDSGVETGNESNDGPLDVKNDIPVEQISTVSLPNVFPLLPESPVKSPMRMASCIFESGLPPFKLPHASLPPGFGENYDFPSLKSRRPVLPCEKRVRKLLGGNRERLLCLYEDWQYNGGLIERKLRVAVSTNNIELVQSYLFAGVNPNCVDSSGRSPLHLASCSGYADIVRLLLENGANPNQRDRLGNTPLHLAACTNNIVVVTLLLKAGTDVCSSDSHGRSPLQLAQSKLKLLCKHMGTDGVVNNYVRNQAFQVSLPLKSNLETIHEIPVYDNSYVTNQALQIVEMMRFFLKKRGQEAEAELLSAFSSRLTLSETKEQVETQVRDLLDSLSGLSLDNSQDDQSASSSSSSSSSSSTSSSSSSTSTFNSITLFPNALPSPNSAPSCSFIPSTSSTSMVQSLKNSLEDNQMPQCTLRPSPTPMLAKRCPTRPGSAETLPSPVRFSSDLPAAVHLVHRASRNPVGLHPYAMRRHYNTSLRRRRPDGLYALVRRREAESADRLKALPQ